MAHIFSDRVRETTTTTGTGTLTLAGAATGGYQAFSAVCANGDTVYYAVADPSGTKWEVGKGTWNTGGTLSRSAGNVLAGSSGAGVLVSFDAGTKDVLLVAPATVFQALTLHLQTSADATSTSTTMANITDLTTPTLEAGGFYNFELVLLFSESVAADGFKMDLDGGSATMTNFRAHATIHDTDLVDSEQVSALATDVTVASVADPARLHMTGSMEVNAAGTFIPRFAQNSHSTGTLTLYRGSYMNLERKI